MPEMHLPGYRYCGPFTKLDERLARGDKPINKLDAGCQQHDIYYRDHKDTKNIYGSDTILANVANERIYASDASIAEKINAALVRAAMNCNSPLPRLLAIVQKHELHSREYDGDVFRG
jgi:hypothetical protein